MEERYGRLVVLARFRTSGRFGWLMYTCRCDCGTVKNHRAGHVRGGKARSCGCLRRELTIRLNLERMVHEESSIGKRTAEYRAWCSARSRTIGKRCLKSGELYQGRGIGFDPRWNDFAVFLADMGRKPSPKHSLDRIDNDKGYSPQN